MEKRRLEEISTHFSYKPDKHIETKLKYLFDLSRLNDSYNGKFVNIDDLIRWGIYYNFPSVFFIELVWLFEVSRKDIEILINYDVNIYYEVCNNLLMKSNKKDELRRFYPIVDNKVIITIRKDLKFFFDNLKVDFQSFYLIEELSEISCIRRVRANSKVAKYSIFYRERFNYSVPIDDILFLHKTKSLETGYDICTIFFKTGNFEKYDNIIYLWRRERY